MKTLEAIERIVVMLGVIFICGIFLAFYLEYHSNDQKMKEKSAVYQSNKEKK